jgi:3-methylcrotonyl-CoA carboxylase alpha subunit
VSGGARPIATLLIANRGEIAVRIMRSAQRMGIRTVAVYADDDAGALHVAAADVAVRLPGASLAETYLNTAAIIAAAKATRADAVHPGYGFLAENAELADACAVASLIFIGPTGAAMRAIGDKAAARRLAAANGIPLVPGYDGKDQSFEALATAAGTIGYPLLIKPAAGGGGKGMRIVERLTDLPSGRQAAKREAKRAFGDDRVILEKYLPAPRHVEVQVLADTHGNTLHLLDRDCSVQRRYQKVVEEAPAPALDPALRASLHDCAVKAARAVDYTGVGTVEFLVADGQFFFMEMNTRLQVEHPVTEAITGLDLVEWQIRVARGEALPFPQSAIATNGHAVEARLLAEDAAADFVPQAGTVRTLRLPEGLPGIRVDSGVRGGDAVSVQYDSLIAKIVAHGADRGEAIARLKAALAATVVTGIATNRPFLSAVIAHPGFTAGSVDTSFIAKHGEDLLAHPTPDRTVLAIAAFAALRFAERAARKPAAADLHSPWLTAGGWRLFGRGTTNVRLGVDSDVVAIAAAYTERGYDLRIADASVSVSGVLAADGSLVVAVRTGEGETTHQGFAEAVDDRLTLFLDGAEYALRIDDPRTAAAAAAAVGPKRLMSPMPGQVVSVQTKVGKVVAKGEPLVVVEAMKMEHTIAAPRAGRIKAVNVAAGDRVAAGVELVTMDDET